MFLDSTMGLFVEDIRQVIESPSEEQLVKIFEANSARFVRIDELDQVVFSDEAKLWGTYSLSKTAFTQVCNAIAIGAAGFLSSISGDLVVRKRAVMRHRSLPAAVEMLQLTLQTRFPGIRHRNFWVVEDGNHRVVGFVGRKLKAIPRLNFLRASVDAVQQVSPGWSIRQVRFDNRRMFLGFSNSDEVFYFPGPRKTSNFCQAGVFVGVDDVGTMSTRVGAGLWLNGDHFLRSDERRLHRLMSPDFRSSELVEVVREKARLSSQLAAKWVKNSRIFSRACLYCDRPDFIVRLRKELLKRRLRHGAVTETITSLFPLLWGSKEGSSRGVTPFDLACAMLAAARGDQSSFWWDTSLAAYYLCVSDFCS